MVSPAAAAQTLARRHAWRHRTRLSWGQTWLSADPDSPPAPGWASATTAPWALFGARPAAFQEPSKHTRLERTRYTSPGAAQRPALSRSTKLNNRASNQEGRSIAPPLLRSVSQRTLLSNTS